METEIDKTALARLMLEWEAKRKELDKIETDIKNIVLELGESFTVGDIRATFTKGRTTYDYEMTVQRAEPDQETVDKFTSTVIDYRGITQELNLEPIIKTVGEPSVTIKIK